ncbi:MAG: amidohydrolase family protein [Desulfococcus multivorans]|jgi:imidazolonepropionase-like amidohydrolase|uniref:amidohydrolase family protein n=1 Tax=Desulfococcus sp. TaxID=2025834 RepID=UPI002A4CC0C0|nr:amidohydrolase family protein [Desulfococcus multivorans]
MRIHVGRLIDGTGAAASADQVITVENGVIRDIRDAREAETFADPARRCLDWSRYTVLPGLVDAHCHLFMSGTADPEVRHRQLAADFEEIRQAIAGHLARAAAHGVVAVRDGGDYGGHALRYKTEEAPAIPAGMTVRAAGRAFRAQGRYGRLIGRPPLPGQSLAEAIREMTAPVDHVKIVNSGLNSLVHFGRQTAPQFTLKELRAAVAAAHARGLKVMVHCNGETPVAIAVEAGCDSVEHGFFMGEENLRRMADMGTVWVPTAVTMKAYARMLPQDAPEAATAMRNFRHQLAQIRLGRDLGVRIAVGTDAGSLGVHHGQAVGEELGILTAAGFSIEGALACAIRVGGDLLDLPGNREIRVGNPARFIAVEGPPDRLPEILSTSRRFDGSLDPQERFLR